MEEYCCGNWKKELMVINFFLYYFQKKPESRHAQAKLAEKVTLLVHGSKYSFQPLLMSRDWSMLRKAWSSSHAVLLLGMAKHGGNVKIWYVLSASVKWRGQVNYVGLSMWSEIDENDQVKHVKYFEVESTSG